MAFVAIWAVVGAPFGLYRGNSVRYLLFEFSSICILAVVVAAAVRNVADLERLLKTYALGAIAFAVLGQGSEGFRSFGGGGYDPNDAAMFVVSGVPLVLFFLIRARSFAGRVVFGGGILACVSAVVLSGSRGGFLALLAVLAFVLVAFKGIGIFVRVAAVAGVLVVIGFSASGDFWERVETTFDADDYNRTEVTGRMKVWTRGMEHMIRNPVFGVGISNFSVAEGQHPDIASRIARGIGTKYSAAHSIWVQAGAELGIPGLLAFVLMFAYAFRALWDMARLGRFARTRGSPEHMALSEVGRPLIGAMIGLAVAGTFLSQAYSSMLWMPFAIALGAVKLLRHGTNQQAIGARRSQGRQRTYGAFPRSGAAPGTGSLVRRTE